MKPFGFHSIIALPILVITLICLVGPASALDLDTRIYQRGILEVDLTNDFSDVEIDLHGIGGDHFLLLVPRVDGGTPTVAFEDLGQCGNVLFSEPISVGRDLVLVYGTPDFNMDEGLNACLIKVTRSDGSEARVKLVLDIYL